MATATDCIPTRLELPPAPPEQTAAVKAWRQPVEMRSYLPGPPDRNPMFLERRVYQGSSGRVYPLPFIDRIAETATLHSWDAIHIENQYIRLMILPQIGGRIHVGLDKTNGYDFFYRQNVIKPALVGLAGPWISGGVEFNWPQHHRPATFMPMETLIERHADGSVTVWCSDHDPLQRMKGMHGICLHPEKAVVEVKVRLYNRTPFTQTFLWWANMATRVHEQYQSFFPPDVRFVADHARRAITSFPRSDRPYYGVDYPQRAREGVPQKDKPREFQPDGTYPPDDLSWYANIPVPTSYMITSTKEDFFGGYDHRARAGTLHFADHHIAPGKKQWTWGNHEFGYAWDRSLTDEDGPYIELMAGVYTDNQPDFSFLAPGETRKFSQYWYPLQQIGTPKAANLNFALNAVISDGILNISVQSTQPANDITITLLLSGKLVKIWSPVFTIGSPFLVSYPLHEDIRETDLEIQVAQQGEILLRYAPGEIEEAPTPAVAREPSSPAEIASSDELYLTGLHLEQYRHATRVPEAYWQEALRRDAGDARSNTALGRWHMGRGEFAAAEQCFNKAITRLTFLNPNPADGEAFYLLGLVLRFLGRHQESYDAFAKAAWNAAWKAPAYHALAQADASGGAWQKACNSIELSLASNSENLNARNLATLLLRKLNRNHEAEAILASTCLLDPLDQWSRHLHLDEPPANNQALLDLVWDYVASGFPELAIELLHRAQPATDGTTPLVLYTLAYLQKNSGNLPLSNEAAKAATAASPDYCFPHRLEDMQILESALQPSPGDARAAYYLGNFFYDRRRYNEAIDSWKIAAELDARFPTVHRNLGIALFNVRGESSAALAAFDLAHQAGPHDGRILYERDQLWKRVGVKPEVRLRELLHHRQLVSRRDDLSVEVATLYNQTGKPATALSALLARNFQPWEGGEGLVLAQFTRAHLLLAKHSIAAALPQQAVAHLQSALHPPASLGEARHLLANQSELQYWLGVAHAAAGNQSHAEQWWQQAASVAGDFQQMSVLAVSEMTYWRGAALQSLHQIAQAHQVFTEIATHAIHLQQAEPKIDYFATSLPAMLLFHEDLSLKNNILAAFLNAQATYGLSGATAAQPLLHAVLAADSNHAAAADLLQQITASHT